MSEVMRVDKLLSRFGYCSRFVARVWCNNDRITLHGEPVKNFAQKVAIHDVRIDGEPVEFPDGILVALHKPVGYVCSHNDGEGARVYDLLPKQWLERDPKIISVGRLDKDTSGLLIVTDQTALVHRFTSPKHHVKKRYRVTLDRVPSDELVAQFSSGIQLNNEPKPCMPATLTIDAECVVNVELQEGKYHQVRRMFAACGYHVVALHREAVGDWQLEDLAEGQWRALPLSSI